MKNLATLVLALALFLVACATLPTPFLNVTPTLAPSPQVEIFTTRVTVMLANKTHTVYASASKTDFSRDAQGVVSATTGYKSPFCIEQEGACVVEGANEMLNSWEVQSIESVCFRATKTGQDYTEPVAC